MTLSEHPKILQGSPEWHALRRGIITASTIGRLITPKTMKPASNPESRSLTLSLVAERITGVTETAWVSDDMMRGIECEPIARDLYSAHHEIVTETGFMVRDDDGPRIGYSPDGLVGDDGLIEVKSPRQKGQLRTILAGHVPSEHMAQLQCGLYVSGRQWCDFLSFHGGMPMWVKRVTPDPKWFAAIVEAARAFEANAAEMVALYADATENLIPTERIIEQEIFI